MGEFNRERIEAAVRAYDAAPGRRTWDDFRDAVDAPTCWWLPDEGDTGGTTGEALWRWLAHVRALDAATNPDAPVREVDALEGVRFNGAAKVAHWLSGENPLAWPNFVDESDAIAAQSAMFRVSFPGSSGMCGMSQLWPLPGRQTVLAHARAQLAGESAPAKMAMSCGWCGESLEHMIGHRCKPPEATPARPAALTLDEIREAAKARGYRVVHESGLNEPDLVLAVLELDAIRSKARGLLMSSDQAFADTLGSVNRHAEIARLRALGVTPAVLS